MRLFNAVQAIILGLGVLGAGSLPAITPLLAQAAPETVAASTADPDQLKAARNLLEATNTDTQFATFIPLVMGQMRQSLPPPGPNQQGQVDQVFSEIEKQFLERRGEILDQIAILYAGKFSAGEMNALADFYRSPVGQKFIAALPDIASESMRLGNAWGERIAREAEQKIRDELQKRGVKL